MKVLTITPWYPSKKDAMAGIFVRNFVVETTRLGAVHEVFSKVSIIDIFKGLVHYSRKRNRPDIVHLHVVTKQGLIALWLRKFYHIPYIITEHWTGYYPENGSFDHLCKRPIIGSISKSFVKEVFEKAEIVTAVSQDFIKKLKELHLAENGILLYNIVPDFFAPMPHNFIEKTNCPNTEEDKPVCNFINVTCFNNKAKNLTGIIDAIKKIKDEKFIFTFIGDGKDKKSVMNYAHRQGVDNRIKFAGQLEPKEVAKLMHKASCLVLNSNYETACVVLQEALVVGLPIISTPVGIAPEYTDHIELIETDNPDMLAEAMKRFIDNPRTHHKGIDDFKESPKKLYSLYETLLRGR